MQQAKLAPDPVLRAYMALLDEAFKNIRMRIRYGESIDMQELHDIMDGLHNIPQMLCAYGGWHVEQNIGCDLDRYDQRWHKPDSASLRTRLVEILERERNRLRQSPEAQPDP